MKKPLTTPTTSWLNRPIDRRNVLKTMGTAGAVMLAGGLSGAAAAPHAVRTAGVSGAPFDLPALPYGFDALEPHVDARTMEIHHGRHHAAYTNNLNTALQAYPELGGKSAEELLRSFDSLPADIQPSVRNNGGGFVNHNLFWEIMAPAADPMPSEPLAGAIGMAFGSFDAFKTMFADAAMKRFGSGWSWLVVDAFGNLKVYSTANQDSPFMTQHVPILGLDVWEHAYYLNYQNRRADYVAAFWNVVNWAAVAEKYDAAQGMQQG